jgi:hypothetical protein
MLNDNPSEEEYLQLVSNLIELLRLSKTAKFRALVDPSSRSHDVLTKARLQWSDTKSIGERLMELGGLDLMHRAAREVRHFSSSSCNSLEDSWEFFIPGYKKIRWLP